MATKNNRKKLFIKACNLNDKDVFFSDFSEQEEKAGYVIKRHCQYCNESEIDDIYYSYWSATWLPVHKKCKQDLSSITSFECQKIDANCNDCKFFISKEKIKNYNYTYRIGECKKGNAYLKLYPKQFVAVAHGNYATGYDCFVHRKG